MPHRLAAAVEPVGMAVAQEMNPAVNALNEAACTRSAIAGALVSRGVHPMVALHLTKYWEATGATIRPEVAGMIHPTLREVARAEMAVRPEIALQPQFAIRPELAFLPELAMRPELAIQQQLALRPTVSPIPSPLGILPPVTPTLAPMIPSPLGYVSPVTQISPLLGIGEF